MTKPCSTHQLLVWSLKLVVFLPLGPLPASIVNSLKNKFCWKVDNAGKWICVTNTLSAAHFRRWFQTLPEIVLHPVWLFFPLWLTLQFCVTCQWVRSLSLRRVLPRWWQITNYIQVFVGIKIDEVGKTFWVVFAVTLSTHYLLAL